MSSKVAIYRRNIEPILQEIGHAELKSKVEALLAYTEQLETASRTTSGPGHRSHTVILPSRDIDATASNYLRDLVVQLQAEPFAIAVQNDFQEVLDTLNEAQN